VGNTKDLLLLELQVNDTVAHALKKAVSDFQGGGVAKRAHFCLEFRAIGDSFRPLSPSCLSPPFLVVSKNPVKATDSSPITPVIPTSSNSALEERVAELEKQVGYLRVYCENLKYRLDMCTSIFQTES
jgi:hypothetical protein